MFINSLSSQACFMGTFLLISSIKRFLPFFISLLKKNDSLLFIGSQFLYSRSINQAKLVAHTLTCRNAGIFSNFSITSLYTLESISLTVLPKMIFFFYLGTNMLLLQEAKSQNLPIVALLSIKDNACLIDYPIVIDSSYFSNTYFFSFFFFRFLQFK